MMRGSMNTQQLRERFEKQYCDDPDTYGLFLARDTQGEYEQAVARLAFIWFARGCQSLEIELPPIPESGELQYITTANAIRTMDIAAIEASGAKIK